MPMFDASALGEMDLAIQYCQIGGNIINIFNIGIIYPQMALFLHDYVFFGSNNVDIDIGNLKNDIGDMVLLVNNNAIS